MDILDPKTFQDTIERLVLKPMTYIEAVINYCANNNIELETVGKLVGPDLKKKIEFDARKKHLLIKEDVT